ncbi:MAG: hypothetical protein ASARMPRED_004145 [Alectoria sarmentosa]|nr:MAG: hypothetical protein ASARMPRED_004145 [Alectoria sarmentosa]
MLGLAFAILNSWTALSASLSLALPSGGPTSVIWGLITAGICNLSLAASMAEFLSAYPTAGGQYHWVAVIAWPKWRPLLSWITGWVNVSGWIALVASGGLLGSQLIVGVISFTNQNYVPQRWHQFLIYIGYNLIAFLLNAFGNSLLPYVTKGAFFWSITGFVIISITVLACSSPDYASGKFVFTTFINEEIPNPHVEGPRIMIATVLIGISTGFIFLVCLLLVSGGSANVQNIIESAAGPLLAIFYQATGSKAGSICLLMFPLVCLLFATISIMTTSSRMTYAFARDGGLPASRFLAKVHSKHEMPLNALILTTVLVVIFGCIFLGSSSAFNAIISASVVALGVSYAIPPAINCLRGRKMLPPRPFVLPGPLGWICNLLGISYVTVTTVLFLFPPTLPVTGSNMNYCIVAFFIVIVISVVQWFVDGRKNYKGPVVELVGEGEDGAVYAADSLDDKAEGAHENGGMGHVNGNE